MAQEVIGAEFAVGQQRSVSYQIQADCAMPVEARWTAGDNDITMVTVSGVGETLRSSPMSDSKWTSFDDSEADGEETSSRHNSESEHQNLLADVDAASEVGDDTTLAGSIVISDDDDPSLAITPQLRLYYEDCFEKLRQEILNQSSDMSKHRKPTDSKSLSSPKDTSSPVETAASGAIRAAATTAFAIWGKHPRVKEFFERSKLDKKELSQIWELADVNKDGWLTMAEFCVAMHLIVRRVQAGLPVPPLLPPHVRPPVTTPIMSPGPMPCDAPGASVGGFWTQFEPLPSDQNAGISAANSEPQSGVAIPTVAVNSTAASVASVSAPLSALSSPPAVLKDFTNVPPNTDSASHASVVQPKARRVTPDFHTTVDQRGIVQQQPPHSSPTVPTLSTHHSASAPPMASKFVATSIITPRPRTSTNDSTQLSASNTKMQYDACRMVPTGPPPAAVPKGPPPKPPPRPTPGGAAGHRHSRSVSLDLSKQMNEMQHQFTAATIGYSKGAPVQEFVSPTSACETPSQTTPASSAFVETKTRDAQVQTLNMAGDKRQSIAPMLDLSMDMGEETPRAAAAVKTPSVTQQITKLGSGNGDAAALGESKDWTKRCDRLRRLNAELEWDLKKLSEVRVGLEMHLKRLEKL